MHAFDVLGDPVRRCILEQLLDQELSAGAITQMIQQEFGISQAAVSQHLKVLRSNGFATARIAGPKRIYAVSGQPFRDIATWLQPFSRFWEPKLAALATEIARGKQHTT